MRAKNVQTDPNKEWQERNLGLKTNSRTWFRNREKQLSSTQKYRETHKTELAQRRRQKRTEKPLHLLLTGVKSRAKERGLSFNLTIEILDAIRLRQNNKCAISGLEMTALPGIHPMNYSVDRIDPSQGYTAENIRLVGRWPNVMKWTRSDAELIQMCQIILAHQKT